MNFHGSRYWLAGIFGDRENGKTTYMVHRLIREATVGQDYDHFFANIHIRHPKIQYIDYSQLKELKMDAPHGIPRTLVGLDQMHLLFDSRASGTKQSREFGNVVIQSRQHGFDALYNTWMRSAVDLRLRRFTPMNIMAEKVAGGFQYYFVDPEKGLVDTKFMSFALAAKEVWPYFDTSELVQLA